MATAGASPGFASPALATQTLTLENYVGALVVRRSQLDGDDWAVGYCVAGGQRNQAIVVGPPGSGFRNEWPEDVAGSFPALNEQREASVVRDYTTEKRAS